MRTRNLVTGGAGFIGSHLIEKLLDRGEEVICLDNYFTGRKANIEHLKNNNLLEIIRHDITEPIYLEVDKIWHLACPASPVHYQYNPIKIAKTSFCGSYNMLGLAKRVGARILFASTSEVYGDPEVHPQPETYKGSVNPIGYRSCYNEGKRIAETLFFDYFRIHKVDISIVRIFNTYGPRMRPDDGRVISNFIVQALKKEPLTIFGDGNQTRSFCFVSELVDGMIKMMDSGEVGPINLGNPKEFTIKELAEIVIQKINPNLEMIFKPLPSDDPLQRKPVIDLAKNKLNWEPFISLNDGLDQTIRWFRDTI